MSFKEFITLFGYDTVSASIPRRRPIKRLGFLGGSLLKSPKKRTFGQKSGGLFEF